MSHSGNRVLSPIMLHVRFLVLLVLGSGTVSYAEGPSPSSGQIADCPRMVVGDSWVYETEGTRYVDADVRKSTVVKVETDGSFTVESVSEKGKKYSSYYNNRCQLVKRVHEKPKFEEQLFDPPLGLDYPLFVGKKWASNYWGQSVGGYKYNYEFENEVTALEQIQTKAGSFECYRIYQISYVDSRRSFSIKTAWYAPSLKSTIKVKPDPGRSGGVGAEELVSYYLAEIEKKPMAVRDTPVEKTQKKQGDTEIETKLIELKQLLDKGLINQEDYNRKKAELLNQL